MRQLSCECSPLRRRQIRWHPEVPYVCSPPSRLRCRNCHPPTEARFLLHPTDLFAGKPSPIPRSLAGWDASGSSFTYIFSCYFPGAAFLEQIGKPVAVGRMMRRSIQVRPIQQLGPIIQSMIQTTGCVRVTADAFRSSENALPWPNLCINMLPIDEYRLRTGLIKCSSGRACEQGALHDKGVQ